MKRSKRFLSGIAGMILIFAFSLSTAIAQRDTSKLRPSAAGVLRTSPAVGKTVWISDIHFDPFYPYSYYDPRDETSIKNMLEQLVDRTVKGSPKWKDHTHWSAVFAATPVQGNEYSSRGHDSNHKLFQEVVEHASTTASAKPDFVMITGDLLGHGFGYNYSKLAPADMQTGPAYNSFVAQTLKYIALSIRNKFPKAPIFSTLGNNDAYCGDYDIRLDHTNSDFLKDTADTFLQYFMPHLTSAEASAFRQTFAQGGYYSVSLPQAGKNRLIVLNSIPFMEKYPSENRPDSFSPTNSSCAAGPVIDADRQMQWLSGEAKAAGRAWIAAHVPPGIDCYGGTPNWTDKHLSVFTTLFKPGTPTANNLAGTFSAHSHMASFKLIRDPKQNAVSFVLQAPSISPNHNNNPTFGVMTYDPLTLGISDYQIYYLDLGKTGWSHFAFGGIQGAVTPASLANLYNGLSNPATWNTFKMDYGSRAGKESDGKDWVSLGDLGTVDPTTKKRNLRCLNSLE